MKIGIEAAYGFGDCVFAVPTIKAIAERHRCRVDVAVQSQCADAFANLPFINKTIPMNGLWTGIQRFEAERYNHIYQLTPHAYFEEFKSIDGNHSLIDTSNWIGTKKYGLTIPDQRPVFIPTINESQRADEFIGRLSHNIIAIESHAKSGQSWADQTAIDMIINTYSPDHSILWLSNTTPPHVPNVYDLSSYTRRELIVMLKACSIFFNVGSGFFCASLALPESLQPKKNVPLWIDHYYKYEWRLAELKWHKNIEWIHNHVELEAWLKDYKSAY